MSVTLGDDSGNDETEVSMSVPTDGITATQIAADAVGTSEIADGSIAAADLDDMGAASGDVLTYNGSA